MLFCIFDKSIYVLFYIGKKIEENLDENRIYWVLSFLKKFLRKNELVCDFVFIYRCNVDK